MSLIVSLQPLTPLPTLPPTVVPDIPVVEPTVEYPVEEEEREPWWLAIAQWVGSWIIDNILRPSTEWFIELIEWITDELRVWKHKFFELMAEVYETDLGFFYITIGTILIGVYAPQIIAKIAASGFGLAIKKIVSWIKEKIGNILNLAAIEDILALNEMAKLMWPEWRDLMSMLSDATSALAEELGQGSAYISAWFSTVHSFALLGISFLDVDPKAAEMQAFEDTENFLKKINENFRRYAHNPGEIIRDIIDELYIPYATDFKDSQQALIGTVASAQETIDDHFTLIQNAKDNLEHFIGIQPDVTAAIVEKKLGPIRDGLDDFIYEYNLNWKPKIEGAIQILENRAAMIEERNAILATKVDDPLYIIGMYDLMPSEHQELFNRAIALMDQEVEDREDIAPLIAFLPVIDDATIQLDAAMLAVPSTPSMSYEAPGFPTVAETPEERARDWFVGEY